MDTLINTKEDVEVLEKAGVLENHLGASEDATRLFNTKCEEVVLGEFTFWKQWHKVEEYCNSQWTRHLASLRRDYFSSPWTLISVIAALILFALTAAVVNKPPPQSEPRVSKTLERTNQHVMHEEDGQSDDERRNPRSRRQEESFYEAHSTKDTYYYPGEHRAERYTRAPVIIG
ncbi:hypothetical protein RJ639_008465 [Escallonia herrerae]|uniref:Uncharacterized protein n=1 Tax=Escallonia herrerae TaxID=1293975 RepID=A0AA89AUN0_9ASTE|nr:hypothetical protein RJ639_008465 [Escallonia herrerae]